MDAAAPSDITVRPATPDDAEFLFGLWAAVRGPTVDTVGVDRSPAQLRHRYTVEEARQRETHPAAIHQVVELGRRPIGQCRLGPHPDAADGQRRNDALVLIDLSLLPTHQPLGADVLAALCRHAEWFGVDLWVDEAACTRHDRTDGNDPGGAAVDSGPVDSDSGDPDRLAPGG